MHSLGSQLAETVSVVSGAVTSGGISNVILSKSFSIAKLIGQLMQPNIERDDIESPSRIDRTRRGSPAQSTYRLKGGCHE